MAKEFFPQGGLRFTAGCNLEDLATSMRASGEARKTPLSVETLNPPYRGDIDMRIARDGTWYYRGTAIRRGELVRLFSSILRKEPEGYVLVTPVEKVGIRVEDAPFAAVELTVTGQGSSHRLRFRTNVEEWVEASACHPLKFNTDA